MDIQTWLETDFYEMLNVSPTSTLENIRKSYRELAKKHHPDISGESEKFKEISEAYKVLSDPELKIQYDAIRLISKGGNHGLNFVSLFGDAFDEGFKEGVDSWKKGKHNNGRGHDIKTKMTITTEEASTGVVLPVSILHEKGCLDCIDGCIKCTDGWIHEEKSLSIRVPRGVKDGQKLKIKSAGGTGITEPGDLYIEITVLSETDQEIVTENNTKEPAYNVNATKAKADDRTVEETTENTEDIEDVLETTAVKTDVKQTPTIGETKEKKEPTVRLPQSSSGPARLKKKSGSISLDKQESKNASTEKDTPEEFIQNETEKIEESSRVHIKNYIPPLPPKRKTRHSVPVKTQEVEFLEMSLRVEQLGTEQTLVSPLGETLRFVVPISTKNNQILRIKRKGKINPTTLRAEDLLVQIKICD